MIIYFVSVPVDALWLHVFCNCC